MEDEFRHKIIIDPVHGDIGLSKLETELIDTPTFQRLRRISSDKTFSTDPMFPIIAIDFATEDTIIQFGIACVRRARFIRYSAAFLMRRKK